MRFSNSDFVSCTGFGTRKNHTSTSREWQKLSELARTSPNGTRVNAVSLFRFAAMLSSSGSPVVILCHERECPNHYLLSSLTHCQLQQSCPSANALGRAIPLRHPKGLPLFGFAAHAHCKIHNDVVDVKHVTRISQ